MMAAASRALFTGGQVSAAAEFKSAWCRSAPARIHRVRQQLDRIMQDQLFGIKTVETIDYIGYSKEHQCYVLGDIAIKNGQLYQVNEEDSSSRQAAPESLLKPSR